MSNDVQWIGEIISAADRGCQLAGALLDTPDRAYARHKYPGEAAEMCLDPVEVIHERWKTGKQVAKPENAMRQYDCAHGISPRVRKPANTRTKLHQLHLLPQIDARPPQDAGNLA